MEKFELLNEVGRGGFGTVFRAIDKSSREIVAIKILRDCLPSSIDSSSLTEVKSLNQIKHPNVVNLKEVVTENGVVHMVFEYMQWNLYELIKGRVRCGDSISEGEIRRWCFQVLQGLVHVHNQGYFHRDLKPENLLVNHKEVLKIADFGLAREIRNSGQPCSHYVGTRWYRAPELLMGLVYGPEVDMWAVGAIMAELFTSKPLFPGDKDQLSKICSVLGSPTLETWPAGIFLAAARKYKFPQFPGVSLSSLIPSASEDAIDLVSKLCSWDPRKRPSAAEALQHPFFHNYLRVKPQIKEPVKSVASNQPWPGFVPNVAVRDCEIDWSNFKNAASIYPPPGSVPKLAVRCRCCEIDKSNLMNAAPIYSPPGFVPKVAVRCCEIDRSNLKNAAPIHSPLGFVPNVAVRDCEIDWSNFKNAASFYPPPGFVPKFAVRCCEIDRSKLQNAAPIHSPPGFVPKESVGCCEMDRSNLKNAVSIHPPPGFVPKINRAVQYIVPNKKIINPPAGFGNKSRITEVPYNEADQMLSTMIQFNKLAVSPAQLKNVRFRGALHGCWDRDEQPIL